MSQSLAWVFSDYEPVIVGRASDGQDPANFSQSRHRYACRKAAIRGVR
jgi:hypothetical protein